MAVVDADACACVRAFRVVVLVLVAGAVVGLCQHVLVPERDEYSQEPLAITAAAAVGGGLVVPGVSEDSIRSTTEDANVHPTVQSVALKHVVSRDFSQGGSLAGLFEVDSEGEGEGEHEGEDGEGAWRMTAANGDGGESRTIGKSMLVPRGRRLRTSRRPGYPCSLRPGTCSVGQTCCGRACVSVATNPLHCGRCGHVCSVKRACCAGKCRRLATDEKNCGRCGTRCASGTKCLFGLCGYSS